VSLLHPSLLRTFIVTVFVGGFALPAFAQDPSERGWVDVNFGIANPAESLVTTNGSRIVSQEKATFGTAYQFSRGADFDFGGGVMLTPVLGIGVSFAGAAHQDPAGLAINIPHPLRFNAFASDATTTDEKLNRTEGSLNLQLVAKAPIKNDRVRVRFFGGPTYFRLKADAVNPNRP
jgi:hypothetical protein